VVTLLARGGHPAAASAYVQSQAVALMARGGQPAAASAYVQSPAVTLPAKGRPLSPEDVLSRNEHLTRMSWLENFLKRQKTRSL